MTHDELRGPSLLGNLGWAFYLACSWTWCIGMFLPVLLYREYGLAGWVVFAVPNVIGAAAMAWVVRDARASRIWLRGQRPAVLSFSWTTIAFQCYFAGWVLSLAPAAVWVIGGTAIVALWSAAWWDDRRTRLGAVAVWLFSAAVLLCLLAGRDVGEREVLAAGRLGAGHRDVLWLAPACGFGFLLCPYLDVTFHHARQQTTRRGGRWAFGLGFGVLFSVMLLLTLLYAPRMARVFQGLPAAEVVEPQLTRLVLVHMLLQVAFTVMLHVRQTARWLGRDARWPWLAAVAGVSTAFLLPRLLVGQTLWGLDGAEVGYRAFMGCYGLVFPAYVVLCAFPARRSRATRRIVFLVAVTLALPLYALGFLGGPVGLLVPGLAVVLAAWALLFARRRPAC